MPSSVPKSCLEHLNAQIKELDPVGTISFDRYLLSGQNLLNQVLPNLGEERLAIAVCQANSYRRAGDEASVYLFLFRFANLILYTIPKHPSCNTKSAKYIKFKQKLRDDCLPELEQLKKTLSQRTIVLPTEMQRKASVDLVRVGTSPVPRMDWQAAGAPTREALPPRLTDIPLPQLAQAPVLEQSPPPQPAVMEGPPRYQSKYAGSREGKEKHSLFGSVTVSAAALQPKPAPAPASLYPSSIGAPTLPALPQPQNPSADLIGDPVVVDIPKEIPLGPQEAEVQSVTPSAAAPGAELENCSCHPPAISQSAVNQMITPAVEMQKTGFRDVHISVEMLEAFLRMARSNTVREIETCAILAGELIPDKNVLEVNHLLVPRQKGTRDQVEMIDEELLLGEVLSNGLMVLGWIHTHPVFQCFLSSIDVHTTLPYQLLLEEAIAIVMAPTDRKRKCGVFRLTTPGGMDLIRKCKLRGFHHHPPTATGQPIYEVSSHVYYDHKIKVTVKDLRQGM